MSEKIKHEDLKCEFCDGAGNISRDSDGQAVEHECSYCKGTGVDENQLRVLYAQVFSSSEPCAACGCSIDAHRDDMTCPSFMGGEFYGWLETKFMYR